MTTQEILQQCTVSGLVVKLPDVQLERDEYTAVKKSLELIGGKWKGGKIAGFVFEQDPTELLAQLASGEQRNLKKEYQFFATPPAVVAMMIDRIPWITNKAKILEPSAGDGAIIKELVKHNGITQVDCYEAMDLNRTKLAGVPAANLLGNDFFDCDLKDTYDLVIANPPFTKNQDIDHIAKMWDVVKPGGVILTLTSPSWKIGTQKKQVQFREWLYELSADIQEIDEGAFKESGTSIRTMLIKIVKPFVYAPVPWEVKLPTKTDNSVKEPEDKQGEIIDAEFEETPKVRTCRKCGCTDENCSQCIEKTGKACHWIEIDLCSACAEQTSEQILDNMIEGEKAIMSDLQDLKAIINPDYKNANFFCQLFEQLDGIDLTLKLKRKNGRLEVGVIPDAAGSINSVMIKGTAEDLDKDFLNTIAAPIQKAAGLKVEMEKFNQSIEETKAAQQEEKQPVKKSTAAAKPKEKSKKAEPAKVEKKKPVKEEEPALF